MNSFLSYVSDGVKYGLFTGAVYIILLVAHYLVVTIIFKKKSIIFVLQSLMNYFFCVSNLRKIFHKDKATQTSPTIIKTSKKMPAFFSQSAPGSPSVWVAS